VKTRTVVAHWPCSAIWLIQKRAVSGRGPCRGQLQQDAVNARAGDSQRLTGSEQGAPPGQGGALQAETMKKSP
jgi:hypothetical protein